ncbi:carbamoyltransferase [Candidatus Pelagibacter sp.]|nr:carbamoyltransferase [Candidatus Pelagibacter sp.]
MYILGINAYHGDAAACIFKDNKILAAAEEERFTRIKHTAGFPIKSIKFCLDKAQISIDQVDHITINRNPNQKLLKKILFASTKLFNFNFIKNRFLNLKKINSIKDEFEFHFKMKINSKIHNIDHHTAHISSSVFFSGMKNSNFLSVDGFGDFVSTVTGYYDGKKITKFNEVLFPHSLGLFYTAMTQYLGFMNYGDEYKVMGLAPYGEPKYIQQLKKIVKYDNKKLFKLNLKYFLHHTGNVEMTWLNGEPKIGRVFSSELEKLLGPCRKKNDALLQFHKDIASSTQKFFEEILINIVNDLYQKNKNENLCISGGSGMNSVANGILFEKTKYKNIYIPPAPGDAGGSLGSAAYQINKINNTSIQFDDNPYLGPGYSDDSIKKDIDNNMRIIKESAVKIKKFDSFEELSLNISKELSNKKIVGFFNERMEWGPRALGNRSILADPRNANIRDLLNVKIKRREKFRPFAPSILEEETKNWFDTEDKVPFMSKVFKVRNEKKYLIPAVTHIDGTGRLQTVSKNYNPRFYNLISDFFKITKVPMLLNTSFNENEPIVCTPKEALDCFLRTKMDILVLGNYVLHR